MDEHIKDEHINAHQVDARQTNAPTGMALQGDHVAQTRRGMLLAQMQGNFINQALASVCALKATANHALKPDVALGVHAALDMFCRAIESKIADSLQSMQESESAWIELARLRKQTASLPSAKEFGFNAADERDATKKIRRFAFSKARDRLDALTKRSIEQSELLAEFMEKTGNYMQAYTRVTQANAEISSLVNGATQFLTEQIGQVDLCASAQQTNPDQPSSSCANPLPSAGDRQPRQAKKAKLVVS